MSSNQDIDMERKVWLVTGTSSGFGKRLVTLILARGDYVIATVRKLADFQLSVSDEDRRRLHVAILDLTDTVENIRKMIDDAHAVWGRIDVLINNAGVAAKTLMEEGRESFMHTQFQTNFFGVITLTNAVLPQMRERKSGTVVFIGSRSVWSADAPTTGYYIASKAALQSAAETYACELAPFGVRVLIACPGAFRTENIHTMPLMVENHIPAYDAYREREWASFQERWRNVPGDPAKAMELLVDAVRGEGKARGRELPLYLFLGKPTYAAVRNHCDMLLQSLDAWADAAEDLDFSE